ncbi:MAG: glycosyltransferase family 4 protein [Tolypothrix carrinoi HA7290-LM1]|jgi:glycosyltransferase involved in cell wall biosynthesis|nr:glycosyltransferase family 4 protein [Tolypothrix carrinoi HA7290-LM1]
MKLAYVTNYSPLEIKNWSGLSYYIAQTLNHQSIPLEYIGPLKDKFFLKAVRKGKRHYNEFFHRKTYLKDSEPIILKEYAKQVSQKLSEVKTDVVFSVTPNPIAYLECNQPTVFWADSTFAALVDFYPHYSNLCRETIEHGHLMENLVLQKCKLAIYASEWAARSAVEDYNADPSKVKVVPFGANLENHQSVDEVKDLIESRPSNKCNLLFLGVDWFRKGGDIAFEVTKALNQSGLNTELTVVGCQPIINEPLPSYVKPLGFINKSTVEGKQKISQLLAESHFLILPSRAECFGVVFCEASSFGVPSLATNAGGIPTAVTDDVNGKLFDLDVNISEYCKYISDLFVNYSEYKKLALSSFHEYQSRLNWAIAGQTVKNLLRNL